jgi:hypothetical protein
MLVDMPIPLEISHLDRRDFMNIFEIFSINLNFQKKNLQSYVMLRFILKIYQNYVIKKKSICVLYVFIT